MSTGRTDAIETDALIRANFLTGSLTGRTVWLGLDPTPLDAAGAAVLAYQGSALLHALGWAARVPQARVAAWKFGRPMASIVSIDCEDGFENIEEIAKIFHDTNTPATLFFVSNLFQKYAGAKKLIEEPLFEFASHSENHEIFEGQPEVAQFDRIQSSRLEIEELTRKRVMGFRPPTEKYDAATVAAAASNKLLYFYGDRRYFRFDSAYVEHGDLLYFPRTLFDDINIDRRRDIAAPEDIHRALVADIERVGRVSGLHLLALHTHIFGQRRYHRSVRDIAARLDAMGDKVWRTTFQELQFWRVNADLVETRVVNEGPKKEILVRSTSAMPISGLLIRVDTGVVDGQSVTVDKLEPGAELRFEVK